MTDACLDISVSPTADTSDFQFSGRQPSAVQLHRLDFVARIWDDMHHSVSALLGADIMRFLLSGWRLAALNLAIRGIDFCFGKQTANSLINNLQLDLQADYAVTNPLSNMNASSSKLPVGESP